MSFQCRTTLLGVMNVPFSAHNMLNLAVQDWKKGNHCMGSGAPVYNPEPPAVEDIDAAKFPLQALMAQIKTSGLITWEWGNDTKINISQSRAGIFSSQCQVIRLERNPSESSGWKRWRVSLPPTFRQQWLDDIVYSQEWTELISDFDSKLLSPHWVQI